MSVYVLFVNDRSVFSVIIGGEVGGEVHLSLMGQLKHKPILTPGYDT